MPCLPSAVASAGLFPSRVRCGCARCVLRVCYSQGNCLNSVQPHAAIVASDTPTPESPASHQSFIASYRTTTLTTRKGNLAIGNDNMAPLCHKMKPLSLSEIVGAHTAPHPPCCPPRSLNILIHTTNQVLNIVTMPS